MKLSISLILISTARSQISKCASYTVSDACNAAKACTWSASGCYQKSLVRRLPAVFKFASTRPTNARMLTKALSEKQQQKSMPASTMGYPSMGGAEKTAVDGLCANPSMLPGDPSIIVTTNVDLGEQKLNIMKRISEAISEATGKPETYVAVCINDKASVIWGGEESPCALGVMHSIGAINVDNNGAVTAALTNQLEPYGIKPNRIYIQFHDQERANVGYNGATFAGFHSFHRIPAGHELPSENSVVKDQDSINLANFEGASGTDFLWLLAVVLLGLLASFVFGIRARPELNVRPLLG